MRYSTDFQVAVRWLVSGLFTICFIVGMQFDAHCAPQVLNYQGVLNDYQGNPVNGRKTMEFRIYDSNTASQTEALWESGVVSVLCINGALSVNLGEAPQNPFPEDLFSSDSRFLGIAVAGEQQDIQRKQLVSVPYALNAGSGIPSGAIIMWSGNQENIPDGWALCDGTNGAPDLRDRFIIGAGKAYNKGDTGGSLTHVHQENYQSHTIAWNAQNNEESTNDHDAVRKNLLNGSYTLESSSLPPFYSLCFIMKL